MTEQTTLAEVPSDSPEGAFRPIQYMGSKARLLDLIREAVDLADPSGGPALDLFSGSGVVAAHLSRSRSVTAVDVQEYARVLAVAMMTPARMTPIEIKRLSTHARQRAVDLAADHLGDLFGVERAAVEALEEGDPDRLCEIVEHGSPVAFALGEGPSVGPLVDALRVSVAQIGDIAHQVTLTRFYGGVYFSYEQALHLDCLLAAVRRLPAGVLRDTGLAAVFGAASECVTSVGSHFAQPIRPRDRSGRPKLAALKMLSRRRERDVFAIFGERLRRYAEAPTAAHGASAVRSDYREFLASHVEPVAVAYADPPYTRDHYSRFYHVLETMARGDDPDVSRVNIGGTETLSRGLYRRDRHQSPFCIRSQAPDAFRALFRGVRRFDIPLVLSYSPYSSGTAARPRPRLLRIPEVVEIAAEFFEDVSTRPGGLLSHSKFNAQHLNGNADREAEKLLVCRP